MYYFEVLILNVMFFQSDFLEKLAVQFHPVLDFSGFFLKNTILNERCALNFMIFFVDTAELL